MEYKNGKRPDHERAVTIMNMPASYKVTNLQAFLGLANHTLSQDFTNACDISTNSVIF